MLLIKTENVERRKRNKRFLLCSTLFCKPAWAHIPNFELPSCWISITKWLTTVHKLIINVPNFIQKWGNKKKHHQRMLEIFEMGHFLLHAASCCLQPTLVFALGVTKLVINVPNFMGKREQETTSSKDSGDL